VFKEISVIHVLKGVNVGCRKMDRRCGACLERLLPSKSAETPSVPGLQAGKAKLRARCYEIITTAATELEKLPRHFSTDYVSPRVGFTGVAAAVAKETCQGLIRTANE